jgi:hypothetical protein
MCRRRDREGIVAGIGTAVSSRLLPLLTECTFQAPVAKTVFFQQEQCSVAGVALRDEVLFALGDKIVVGELNAEHTMEAET